METEALEKLTKHIETSREFLKDLIAHNSEGDILLLATSTIKDLDIIESLAKKACECQSAADTEANEVLPGVMASLPFSEYHQFHKWIENEGWYEAASMEYDKFSDTNSCVRLTIAELYKEWKGNEP